VVSSTSSGGAAPHPVSPQPSSAQPGPHPAAPSAALRRRGRFSIRDIALSFGVLIVPILIVIVGSNLLGAEQVTRVDPNDAYASAEATGQFTVLRPEGLGRDWYTTAADTTRSGSAVTLRLGLVAPSGKFARIAESGRPASKMLAAELGGTPRSTGAEEINGQPWLRYPGRDREQALVSVRRDGVVVVTGTADLTELRTLAASLR
jgi:hypothetical protein